MKHAGLWGSLAGLVVAAGIFATAWSLRGARDERAVEAERARAQQQAYELGIQHQRETDSLARVNAAIAAQHVADSLENLRLRQLAAEHAAADRARDSVLAAALSECEGPDPAGQLEGCRRAARVAIAQRDDARAAYAGAILANTQAIEAAARELARVQAVAERRRVSDSTLYASQRAALATRNDELALTVETLKNKGKLFGLLRIPWWLETGVKVGLGVYLGAKAADCVHDGCRLP